MSGGDLGGVILSGALRGAELEVRTEVAPPIRVNLSALFEGGPPGTFTRIARPTYTLRRDGEVLFSSSPAGPTDDDAWKVTLVVSVLASLALLALVGLAFSRR